MMLRRTVFASQRTINGTLQLKNWPSSHFLILFSLDGLIEAEKNDWCAWQDSNLRPTD
jgi:hypothetical protein